MKVTFYHYPKCGTCRAALKWLTVKGIETDPINLFEQPPTIKELGTYVEKHGVPIKKLFNTSGEVYKEMNLKDRLPGMSQEEMLALLASNGRLIKRPIATDGERITVGYKEPEYESVWGSE